MEKVKFQLRHTIDAVDNRIAGLQTLDQCFPHPKKPEVTYDS